MQPNVIVIVLDTARADAFEPYGASAGSSPAIADLARRGTALRAMHAAASWTLPSHASMFTGLPARATGILDLPHGGTPLAARPVLEASRDRMLPEVLRRNGYETGAVSTNLWVAEESGFAVGFDEFRAVDTGRQSGLHEDNLRARVAWDLEGIRARADDGAEAAGSVLRSWIDTRAPKPGGSPFFWFVNLIECHSPYLPPRPWNDLGLLERRRAAVEARRHLTMGEIWKACAGGFDVPVEALERMRHLYDRSIALMDAWLANLLEALDAAGELERTLVMVTSDHGENFGEGGLMGHAFSLDQRLLHVPFVAAGPGAPDDRGVQSLTALPSMIADAAGLEDHPWEAPSDGIAVAEFEPPGPGDDPRWLSKFDEWGLDPGPAGERIGRRLKAATDGRWKLQLRGEREELFDLQADPLELRPREPTAGDEVSIAPLRAALAHSAAGEPAAAPAPGEPAPEIDEDERERLEERMKLLGYM
jgi:arylsulfatase A-like enzyme